jgi:uncharacterized protein (UPF0276 family)
VTRVTEPGVGLPGVGLLFNPALADFVRADLEQLNHLAVIPDRAWIDHGPGHRRRFEELPVPLAPVEQAAHRLPIALHAIGLSILSADFFDTEYLDQLARWCERLNCAWVSEHLSFTRVGSGHGTHAALALAMPYDAEALDLLIPRVRSARRTLGVPFLLENLVAYVDYGDEEMSEAEFFNALMAETGCGMLLDLHNLYANARNRRCDAHEYLRQLDLSGVIEIHIAGGDEMMGLHTDSHAGPVHAEVWPLLEWVLPRSPNLRAVTFEFHEGSWPLLHRQGVLTQLNIACRAIERAGIF